VLRKCISRNRHCPADKIVSSIAPCIRGFHLALFSNSSPRAFVFTSRFLRLKIELWKRKRERERERSSARARQLVAVRNKTLANERGGKDQSPLRGWEKAIVHVLTLSRVFSFFFPPPRTAVATCRFVNRQFDLITRPIERGGSRNITPTAKHFNRSIDRIEGSTVNRRTERN